MAQDVIAVLFDPSRQRLALAAAPSYVAAQGTPLHSHELSDHDCIRFRFSSGALAEWAFEKNGEAVVVDPSGRLIVGVDSTAAAIDLACRGQPRQGTQ